MADHQQQADTQLPGINQDEIDTDTLPTVGEDNDPFAVTPFDDWVNKLPRQHHYINKVKHDKPRGVIYLKGHRQKSGNLLTAAMAEKFLRNGYVPVEAGKRHMRLRRFAGNK